MEVTERARKNQTIIFRCFNESNQTAIAAAVGMTDGALSKIKNERINQFAEVLAHLGLKVVPANKRCFDEDEIDGLLTFAKGRLNNMKNAEQLAWD